MAAHHGAAGALRLDSAPASPIGWWRCNTDPASYTPWGIKDESANANNAVQSSSANRPTYTATSGGYVTSDGNDFADAGEGGGLFDFTSAYTITAWIYLPAADEAAIVEKGYFTSTGGYMLRVNGTNVAMYVRKANRSSAPIATGAWQHVVGKWDGASTYIYINGAEKDKDAFAFAPTDTTNTLQIARYSPTFALAASLSDIRVYNVSLSAAAIMEMYMAEPTVAAGGKR
jgi:hypothetical protein